MKPPAFVRLAVPVAAFLLLGASARGEDRNHSTTYIAWAGPQFGQALLGSEDARRGGFYSLEYARPEKRLAYKGHEGQLSFAGYYLANKGGGFDDLPVDHLHGFGALATARYWRRSTVGVPAFFEFGFGLLYINHTTRDMDSQLLTTPVMGVGIAFPVGGQEMLFSARLFHASNGGAAPPNQGFNSFQLLVGYRF